jgi:hypothetical protein
VESKYLLACLVFGFPEGMSREEGRPVSRAKKNGLEKPE